MAFKGTFPANKAVPSPYGLFSVAKVVKHSGADDHWAGGFSQETEMCAFDASIVDICGAETPIQIFDSGEAERFFDVPPFGIIAKDECLTQGWSVEDRRARVTRQLEVITPKAVEVELWNGLYRQALDGTEDGSYLSSTAADVVHATAQKYRVGLAILEQALADCSTGVQGTIHMTPLVASMMGEDLQVDGGQLVTSAGNLVAVGTGYDGRGPGENVAPADEFVHWIYATGPVSVHIGVKELVTISAQQATNPVTNVMTYVAERPASVNWDGCCHLAAKIDIRL